MQEESNDDQAENGATYLETFHVFDGVLTLKFGNVTIATSAKFVLVEPTDEHE